MASKVLSSKPIGAKLQFSYTTFPGLHALALNSELLICDWFKKLVRLPLTNQNGSGSSSRKVSHNLVPRDFSATSFQNGGSSREDAILKTRRREGPGDEVGSRMNSSLQQKIFSCSLLFERTIKQTTGTMPLALKRIATSTLED